MSYDELRQKYRKIIRQIDEISNFDNTTLHALTQSIKGNWGDQLGSLSGVLDPFDGLWRALKPTVSRI